MSGLWAARSRPPQSYESARLERERAVSPLERVHSPPGPRRQLPPAADTPTSPVNHRPAAASDGAALTIGRHLLRSTDALSSPPRSSPTRWGSAQWGAVRPSAYGKDATSEFSRTTLTSPARSRPGITRQPSAPVEASSRVNKEEGSDTVSQSGSASGSSGESAVASPVRRKATRSFQEALDFGRLEHERSDSERSLRTSSGGKRLASENSRTLLAPHEEENASPPERCPATPPPASSPRTPGIAHAPVRPWGSAASPAPASSFAQSFHGATQFELDRSGSESGEPEEATSPTPQRPSSGALRDIRSAPCRFETVSSSGKRASLAHSYATPATPQRAGHALQRTESAAAVRTISGPSSPTLKPGPAGIRRVASTSPGRNPAAFSPEEHKPSLRRGGKP